MHAAPRIRGVSKRRCDVSLWASAAALPLASHASAILVNLEPNAWLTMAEPIRRSLAADAMLHTAGCAIVAAPLAGVAAVARRRLVSEDGGLTGNLTGVVPALTIAAALFTTVSSVISMMWLAGQPGATSLVVQAHATVLSVALALAGWGALCAAWFRDPLDAAGCSLVTVLVAACGLLVGGATVSDLSPTTLSWGLTASPLMVIASAAQIDLVRMDVLYQISPLAHIQFEYPSWQRACASYTAVAFACFLAFRSKSRTWFANPRPERTI